MTTEIKKQYYDTGKIMSETPYENGVKNWLEKCYNITGEIEKKFGMTNVK